PKWLMLDVWLGRIGISETDVVGQGVEPDIGHKVFVERQLNSPVEPRLGTRDAKVAADSFDRVPQFGLAKIGNDRVFSIVEILKQPLFVLTQSEVIIFFLAKLDLAPFRSELTIRAALLIGQELLLAD